MIGIDNRLYGWFEKDRSWQELSDHMAQSVAYGQEGRLYMVNFEGNIFHQRMTLEIFRCLQQAKKPEEQVKKLTADLKAAVEK